jgi:hypothetical protein
MAARKKGTFAKAQSALSKAMRDFENAVSDMAGGSEPKAKKAKRKKAKRKTKARGR